MFRPLELFVGLRYTRAKRRNHFISFISLISMLGVALGVAALITVLSVMNGFEKELRERILGMAAHVTITGAEGEVRDWRAVAVPAGRDARVLDAAPFVSGQGMLSRGNAVHGVLVRGIDPALEPGVSDVGAKMVAGSLDELRAGEFAIVLGRELAYTLGAGIGDKVTLLIPQANVTVVGVEPRMKRFTVVGLFEVGMYDYDSALALLNLEDAARLFRLDAGAVSGVRLKLDDLYAAPLVVRELAGALPPGYRLTDWTRQHANFFRAIRIEKTVMFVILLLIVAVAAFNIVSTLVMTVTDKTSDIAILRTLGTTPRRIMLIFMVQGSLIGAIGTLIGVAGGVALALNVETIVPAIEHLFGIQFLSADVYYISELPSDMHWSDVLRISAASLGMGFFATLYPAWRASRTQPAEALRYE
jgi:lipoprotein-releasing system permease protein